MNIFCWLLAAFIKAVISSLGYPGIALLMGIESACIPLPSEVIMPFAGYLVYAGRFSFAGGGGNPRSHRLQSRLGAGL